MSRTREGDLTSNGAKKRQLDRMYKKYKGICQLCSKFCPRDQASRDHVIELSKGGSHEDFNVVLAHKSCNNEKSNAPLSIPSKLVASAPADWWPKIIAGQIKGCLIRQSRGEPVTGVTLRRFENDPEFRSELCVSV